jgi:hypothetical protein
MQCVKEAGGRRPRDDREHAGGAPGSHEACGARLQPSRVIRSRPSTSRRRGVTASLCSSRSTRSRRCAPGASTARTCVPRRSSACSHTRPASGVGGPATSVDRDPTSHDPVPSDEARRRARARDAATRAARPGSRDVAHGMRRSAGRHASDHQQSRRGVDRVRLGQLAESHVPRRGQGGWSAGGHSRWRSPCPPAGPAVELRDAPHLRRS